MENEKIMSVNQERITCVEEAITSHRNKIEALENDNKRLEEHRILNNKTITKFLNDWTVRVKALEKKLKKWSKHTVQDYFKMSKVLTHVRNNTEQIAELPSSIKYRQKLDEIRNPKAELCSKCGSRLVLDVISLNKPDWYCIDCNSGNKKPKTEPEPLNEKAITEYNRGFENGYNYAEEKLIEEFVKDLNSNMWITEIRKKWLDRR